MKSTDGNADTIWPNVGVPKHRRSARRAEMHPYFSSVLPVADIDFGWSLGANILPLEISTNAKHQAGAPLTLATMADADGIGISGYLDTQGTATAMRGSSHNAPPLSDAGRLQESGCQNDPFTADRAQFIRTDTKLGRGQVITGQRRRLRSLT